MYQLADYFQPAAVILALITSFILLQFNKTIGYSKNLLVLLIVFLAILNINGIAFHKNVYLILPYFHKILIPFSLLIGPLCYLYIRSVIKGQIHWTKSDMWFLIPFFVYVILLLPYYFTTGEEKLNYVKLYYQNRAIRVRDAEGWMPAFLFPTFRVIWTSYFVVRALLSLKKYVNRSTHELIQANKKLLRWLFLVTLMILLLVIAAFVAAVSGPWLGTAFNLYDISLSLVLIILCSLLLIRPEILYGLHQPTVIENLPRLEDSALPEETTDKTILKDEIVLKYRKELEEYFADSKRFLHADFSLFQLAQETGIPKYILSHLINREYGIGFREYLNKHRIHYLIDHHDQESWKNFTLEAMSHECGFKSRKTFIDHFRKLTGKTPGEYFKNR